MARSANARFAYDAVWSVALALRRVIQADRIAVERIVNATRDLQAEAEAGAGVRSTSTRRQRAGEPQSDRLLSPDRRYEQFARHGVLGRMQDALRAVDFNGASGRLQFIGSNRANTYLFAQFVGTTLVINQCFNFLSLHRRNPLIG